MDRDWRLIDSSILPADDSVFAATTLCPARSVWKDSFGATTRIQYGCAGGATA